MNLTTLSDPLSLKYNDFVSIIIVIIRVYELLMDVRLCKFEATSMDERRFRFRAADCEAMVFSRVRELTYALTFFIMLYGLVLENLYREPQRVVRRNFHGWRKNWMDWKTRQQKRLKRWKNLSGMVDDDISLGRFYCS
jgi:hypothetical protein